MIRLATEDFIPVSADDWYQRRREDAEGKFFRKVADQGPRKGQGGSTRQGIYCFTASGKLLAYKNAQDAKVMRETIELGLKRFKALPESERKPGVITVEDHGKLDTRYARTPPDGGLILRVYTRILSRDDKKGYVKGECKFQGGDAAARDHLWLKKAEWQSLLPKEPKVGNTFEMPAALSARICRFHLVDNTRGEPEYWRANEVRRVEWTWKVALVDDKSVTLEGNGSAMLSTEVDSKKSKRGYEAALTGRLKYDRKTQSITQLEILAVGDHWGRSTYTPGDRPGRQPLGVVFELVTGKVPAERVPPQAAREVNGYFAAK